jgi:hypothetical protein
MATSLTPPNLVPASGVASPDLFVVWPTAAGGPLSKLTYSQLVGVLQTSFTGTFLLASNNLSDVTNPTMARTSLGLQSAALANIGTSGANVPLLNTANAWSAQQSFGLSVAGGIAQPLTVYNTVPTWTAGCAVQINIQPYTGAGGTNAAVRSTALARATDADLSFWTSNNDATVQAAQINPNGDTTLYGANQARPNRPAFEARLASSVGNVTGDGTALIVSFNQKTYDRHSDFNTTTNQFIAPFTGLYTFTAQVTFSSLAATHTFGLLNILIASTSYISYLGNAGAMRDAVNSNRYSARMTVTVQMNAGDAASVQVQIGGTPKQVGLDANAGLASQPDTYFSGYMVG